MTRPEIEIDWTPAAGSASAIRERPGRPDDLTAAANEATGRSGPSAGGGEEVRHHIGELITSPRARSAVSGVASAGTVRGMGGNSAGREQIELRAAMDRGGDRLAIISRAEPTATLRPGSARNRRPTAWAALPAPRSIDLLVTDGSGTRGGGSAASTWGDADGHACN